MDLPDLLFGAPTVLVIAATLSFLVAGTVKGTFGIGLPITAVGLLSQFIDPREAVALAIVPIVAANVVQVWRAGRPIEPVRLYWPLLLATSVIFVIVTTLFLREASTQFIEAMLGVVVVFFAASNLFFRIPPIPDRHDRLAQLITAIPAGIVGGLTGLWGPPVFVYLLARGVERDDFVRATGTVLLIGTLPLVYGYWLADYFTGPVMLASALLLVPMFIGFTLGEQIRRRIDAQRFRRAILVLFLLIGANLLRGALFP